MKKESFKKLTNLTLATTLTITPTLSPIAIYATPQEELELVDSNQIEMSEPIELDVENAEELLLDNELQTEVDEQSFELEDELVESMTSNTEEITTPNDLLIDENIQSNNAQTELIDIKETIIESSLTSLQSTEEFNLADWTYSEDANYITLRGYKGKSTSLSIPGEYKGKRIRITGIRFKVPLNTVSLKFETVNGTKVLYDSTSLTDQIGGMNELTTLDLSGLDTSKVTNMNRAFEISSSFETNKTLTTLNLSGLDTSSVTNMSRMFFGLAGVRELDLSSFDTSNVTNMNMMFEDMENVRTLDLSSFNTSNVTNMTGMFDGVKSLQHLDLSSFNTSNVTSMHSMFKDMKSLISLDLNSFDTSNVTNMAAMFSGMTALQELDLSLFNTSNVTTMSEMFLGMTALKELDLSSFNTSSVTTMHSMFKDMKSLISLDLSLFNTSKVTTMGEMFRNVKSLTSLNVTSFDTSNVEFMNWMFSGMNSLRELDLSSFNTSKVTGMREMFSYCSSLTSLNVTSFDTSKVVTMSRMFMGLNQMEVLDLSSFKLSIVTDTERMLGCPFSSTPYQEELIYITQDNVLMNKDFNGICQYQKFSKFTYPRLTTSSETVTGYGIPGAKVSIHSKKGDLYAYTFVNSDGSYEIPISKQLEGAELQIKMSKESYPLISKDFTVLKEFKTFTHTIPSPSETIVSGKGEPGAEITISSKYGYHLDTTVVNDKGDYQLKIRKLSVGHPLVIMQSKDGYLTISKEMTVLNKFETFTVMTTPTISTTAIYGTGVPGANVGIYSQNGTLLDTYTVNSKGNYKLVIPKQKAGEALTIKQSKDDYLTVSKNITVLNEFETFTIKTTPTTSTTAIYGTGVSGSKVGVYDKNGKRLALTTVNSKGNYKLVIPKQKAGAILTIKQAKSGYLTASKNITVLNEFKTFTIKTNPTSSTTAIYGTGVAGSKVGIYDKTGKRLAITTVNSKGNYKLVIPKQKVGTVLTIKQAKSGYLTTSKNVTVLNEFKTFSITTKINSKTTTIYGKGIAGAKVGIYDKNGKRLAITTVNSKGNYKLVIPKQKAGVKLTFKQAKSGYLTASKTIPVVK